MRPTLVERLREQATTWTPPYATADKPLADLLNEAADAVAERERLEAENARLRALIRGVMTEDKSSGGHGCFPSGDLCAGSGLWHIRTCMEARALTTGDDRP
jgi:hypothetical protein